MEKQRMLTPNPEYIKEVLEAQSENLLRLRHIVSGISSENMSDIRKLLLERLRRLEELEQQLSATLTSSYTAAHRMTMDHH